MRYLVEAGSRWLERNPALSQQEGVDIWNTTGDVRYATVFDTLDAAAEAATTFKQHYRDWAVRVQMDWRMP